jgi:hypothetical protein
LTDEQVWPINPFLFWLCFSLDPLPSKAEERQVEFVGATEVTPVLTVAVFLFTGSSRMKIPYIFMDLVNNKMNVLSNF